MSLLQRTPSSTRKRVEILSENSGRGNNYSWGNCLNDFNSKAKADYIEKVSNLAVEKTLIEGIIVIVCVFMLFYYVITTT